MSLFCLLQELDNSDEVYPFQLVSDQEHGIMGSCSTYTTRRDVTDDVRKADGLPSLTAVHQRSPLALHAANTSLVSVLV